MQDSSSSESGRKTLPKSTFKAKKRAKVAVPTIRFVKFFKYISGWDRVYLVIGALGAICAGLLLPSISLVMGEVSTAFGTSNSRADTLALMSTLSVWISIVAVAIFLCSYIFFAFWQHLAENISMDLRSRYMTALLQQEIAYFENMKVE